MRLLLDTHTLIWLDSEPERLSDDALAACETEDNELCVSVATIWEVQIKHQLGRLDLRVPDREIVTTQTQANGLQVLPISADHVYALEVLPLHHKDPFDRLILATAQAENMAVVSQDSAFPNYPVRLIW